MITHSLFKAISLLRQRPYHFIELLVNGKKFEKQQYAYLDIGSESNGLSYMRQIVYLH